MLCWSAKWLDEKKILRSSLPDFRGYRPLPSKTEMGIDKGVMKGLWKLLDECDVAVAHNLKGFDNKKANTRFLINGMKPPSPYHMIDTLAVARSQFKFTSNKLEYLSKKLGVTQKMDVGGFDTWLGCEEGDKKAWDKMVKYCDTDVRALEDVYLKELPFINNHPNLSIITGEASCPKCQSKDMARDGLRYTNSGVFQRLRCKQCGTSNKVKKDRVTNA